MGATEKAVVGERGATDEHAAALDALHRDVYANHMAPYWVVDKSVAHDEDRQVMQGRKAVPFIWKYKRQIEPLLMRSAELIKTVRRLPGE
jgi:gentisate 1,2-dioxygenase